MLRRALAVALVVALATVAVAIALAAQAINSDTDRAEESERRASATASALGAVDLMFCRPLTRETEGGALELAVVSEGEVVYEPDSCRPERDASGAIQVRPASGAVAPTEPEYVPDLLAASTDWLVWIPALGNANGADVEVTGRLISRDANVVFDAVDRPHLELSITGDGRDLFGSMTERNIGLPLATFVDGMPLRGEDGRVIAPIVMGKIEAVIFVEGLSLDDAQRISLLASEGKLR